MYVNGYITHETGILLTLVQVGKVATNFSVIGGKFERVDLGRYASKQPNVYWPPKKTRSKVFQVLLTQPRKIVSFNLNHLKMPSQTYFRGWVL